VVESVDHEFDFGDDRDEEGGGSSEDAGADDEEEENAAIWRRERGRSDQTVRKDL